MMARWNGKDQTCWDTVIFEKEAEDAEKPIGFEEAEAEAAAAQPAVSWRDIWAVPILRTNLWAAAMLYAEGTFNFYLLSFYLKYFPGNIFANSAYFACSDLIAFVGAGTLLNYAGMKISLRVASTIAMTGGLMYLFLSQHEDLIPFMICFSRIGQSMIFNTTLICVNRLFPTLFIANAYGIVNFIAHSVACISPFVAEVKNPYPFIVFCFFVSLAIVSSFFLKEIDSSMDLGAIAKKANAETAAEEMEDKEAKKDGLVKMTDNDFIERTDE